MQSPFDKLALAMFINGLGTALPARRYTQAETWTALQEWDRVRALPTRAQALLRKILLGDNGIHSRHFALGAMSDSFDLNPDVLQARFTEHAPALAAEAATQALQRAGILSEDIDAVIISTCTGYLCPGLTSYVSERLGLRPDVLPLDLVGQGCGAALPNLRTGEALVASGGAANVLSICVEVCSAAAFIDEDPGVLVSACLFGDGAAAAVLSAEPATQARRVEWKAAASHLDPAQRDQLRFEHRGGLMRNILRPTVPALAAAGASKVFRAVAEQSDVKHKEIAQWIFHAGGRDVLLALRQEFNLQEADTRWSTEVLRDAGNVSSPFVLMALERALRGAAPGGWWWMSSFGAGFSCHGALLEVE